MTRNTSAVHCAVSGTLNFRSHRICATLRLAAASRHSTLVSAMGCLMRDDGDKSKHTEHEARRTVSSALRLLLDTRAIYCYGTR